MYSPSPRIFPQETLKKCWKNRLQKCLKVSRSHFAIKVSWIAWSPMGEVHFGLIYPHFCIRIVWQYAQSNPIVRLILSICYQWSDESIFLWKITMIVLLLILWPLHFIFQLSYLIAVDAHKFVAHLLAFIPSIAKMFLLKKLYKWCRILNCYGISTWQMTNSMAYEDLVECNIYHLAQNNPEDNG